MSDLSPLLGEERKSDFGAVRSVGTHIGHWMFGRIFDPKETLAALAPEDKADPRVDEVYLSGERQRPV